MAARFFRGVLLSGALLANVFNGMVVAASAAEMSSASFTAGQPDEAAASGKRKKPMVRETELPLPDDGLGVGAPAGAGAVAGAGAGVSGLAVGAGIAAAAAGVAAAAAGGGGGGGGDSPAPSPRPFVPAPGNEANAQAGLFSIHALDAQAKGLSGAGITIGIVDGGIDAGHSEFTGRIRGCFDAASGRAGCGFVTPTDHSTHVSGIAAAAKNDKGMIGVAPGADLLNADIFAGAEYAVDRSRQAVAINWLVGQGANVLNNSYGIDPHNTYSNASITGSFGADTAIGQAYQNAVDAGKIFVWSTGNDGDAQPNLHAALPLYLPGLQDKWIAATAVKAAGGTLTNYANACGAAASFCIAAPGGQFSVDGGIYSSITGERYGRMSGTSMAAPHVTGAVAVLLEKFGPGTPTNKSPEQVVDLLFATADKSGIYADSALYGQGLLDLDKATEPDAATLAFAVDGTALVSETSLALGPAFGDAMAQALDGRLAGATDKYGRMYFSDLGNLASGARATTDGGELLRHFKPKNEQLLRIDDENFLRLSFSDASLPKLSDETKQAPVIESLSLLSRLPGDIRLGVHYGVDAGTLIGLQASSNLDNSLLAANDQTINPYLDFSGQKGYSAGLEFPLSEWFRIKSLAFGGQKEKPDPWGMELIDQKDTVFGAAFETSLSVGKDFELSLLAGSMTEDERILGMEGDGGMALGTSTPTFFIGPSLTYRLHENLDLVGTWQTGWTNPGSVDSSLFSDFSPLRSDSFTLGLTGTDLFQSNDRWGLLVHQPLRVNNGEATLSIPVRQTSNGNIVYQDERLDLEPSGREKNFQAFYSWQMDDKQDFSAGLMLRDEPGHIEDNAQEGVALFRYRFKF